MINLKMNCKGRLIGTITFMLLVFMSVIAFAAEPEFDGAYVKTRNGKYLDVKEQKASTTQLSKGRMDISQLMHSPQYYYVVKNEGTNINSEDFAGLLVKGNVDFKNMSVHKVSSIVIGEGGNLFENRGPARNGSTIYFPGQKLELRQKAAGTNGYYYEPKEKLESGSYVMWSNKSLWFINVDVTNNAEDKKVEVKSTTDETKTTPDEEEKQPVTHTKRKRK